MYNWLKNILNIKFPPNLFFQRPEIGAMAVAVISYLFVIIYRPMGTQPSYYFGYELTMAIYCLAVAMVLFLALKILRFIPFFRDALRWTLLKELSGVLFVLFFCGVGVYFAGFLIEDTSVNRWNFPTFLDSLKGTFIIVIVPFGILFLRNVQLLLPGQRMVLNEPFVEPDTETNTINIHSSLKKEHLTFLLSEFVYAEADGNYVSFCLMQGDKSEKKLIRNSINNIQWQLGNHSNCFRSHRGFIVNLDKIKKMQGNSSGYRLTLDGTNAVIPVSRYNVEKFESLMALK